MSVESVVSWIVCGLLVGICARFFVPGRQYMSLVMTALLGIGGAVLGGFLYSYVDGSSGASFSLTSDQWSGWIVAILGAMLLLWVYPYAYPRKWWK